MMTDEELELLLGEARTVLDVDIAAERRDVVPDFCALIEAAHTNKPELVSEAALREVAEFAPIVELGSDEHHDDPEFSAEFAAMIDDVREQVAASVACRRLAGIPPLRSAVAPQPAAREGGPNPMAMLAALAAILVGVAVGLPRLLEFVGDQHQAKQINNQAEFRHEAGEQDGVAESRRFGSEPEPQLIRPEPEPQAAIVRQFDGAARVSDRVGEAQRMRQHDRKRDSGVGDSGAGDSSLRDRVAELEQRARAHWQAGELADAEARYREILGIAGRSRYADLAFGDLFTLAHQRKDAAAELGLWREYLDAFPRGRFAEDARAGICRRADAGERTDCWHNYLDDYPAGLHAARARRELGEAP